MRDRNSSDLRERAIISKLEKKHHETNCTMFKTMSTNKDRPNGKFTGEASTKGKSSNWDFGVDDHEPAMTVTARDFAGFGDQKPEKRDKIPQPPV